MAPAAAPSLSAVENQVKEALKQVNTITLNQITSRLKTDPTVDLSELFRQQVDSYPRIRNVLAQSARQRSLETPAAAVPKPATSILDATKTFLMRGKVRVMFPLQDRVLSLVAPRPAVSEQAGVGLYQEVDDGTVAALNQAFHNSQVLWHYCETSVLDFGSSVAVKISPCVNTDHVPTFQYIKDQAPDLPAPDIPGILKTDQQTYFSWCELVPSQRLAVQHQLNSILRILRIIPRPGELAEAALGGGVAARCKDVRRSERIAGGQIETEAEFHDFLCSEPGRSNTPWIKMIRSSMRDDHAIVMTHGDLHPRNIMVTQDGATSIRDHSDPVNEPQDIRISSIIDWKMIGWYPDYWEFVKALNTIGPKDTLFDWCEYLPTEAIGTWPVEYAIDTLISRWLG